MAKKYDVTRVTFDNLNNMRKQLEKYNKAVYEMHVKITKKQIAPTEQTLRLTTSWFGKLDRHTGLLRMETGRLERRNNKNKKFVEKLEQKRPRVVSRRRHSRRLNTRRKN